MWHRIGFRKEAQTALSFEHWARDDDMGCGRASSLYIEQKNSQELNLVGRGREAVRAFFVAL